MRILHTADWHLGSRLHGNDRTDDLFDQVKQVCEIAKQHEVEVLLVAGDVFEKRGIALPELTKRLAELLAPYIRDGMHVVLLPGNHDDREHFNMMRALLTLEQGHSERVHIIKTRDVFLIGNVQFAAIPYPLHEVLQPYLSEINGATERNVSLSTAYANMVRSVLSSIDPSLPTVFIAHINVAGVTTPSEHELTYDEGIRLGRGDLPIASNLKYIALGHIHQSQKIDHPVPCFYSGSIDKMNWGEKEDQKQVILIDIPDDGDADVTLLEIKTTPFYSIDISTSQLETLPSTYPDLDRAFAIVNVNNDNGVDPASIYRIVREICPRQIGINIAGINTKNAIPDSALQSKNYSETVQSYLAERYKGDQDLPELENLTNQLLSEVENVNSTD
jgi:DNA repair protein SbcD/Mre11